MIQVVVCCGVVISEREMGVVRYNPTATPQFRFFHLASKNSPTHWSSAEEFCGALLAALSGTPIFASLKS